MEILAALVLGIVEGVTEFIPVSSTGHLILAGHALGFEEMVGKEVADVFVVFVQLGAILAVVAAYPERFAGLLRFRENRGLSGFRGLGLLAVTSFPAALLGLAAHRCIKENLFNSRTVALGLGAGAAWILVVEFWRWLDRGDRRPPRRADVDSLSWLDALGIGLFQCLSLWPGMSRSSSTILGGMMLGIDRKAATEYSFFAAVPLLAAAGVYDLAKSLPHLGAEHVPLFAVGLAAAFLSAWLAVRLLIRFLARRTFVPFGVYRLAVTAVVLWSMR